MAHIPPPWLLRTDSGTPPHFPSPISHLLLPSPLLPSLLPWAAATALETPVELPGNGWGAAARAGQVPRVPGGGPIPLPGGAVRARAAGQGPSCSRNLPRSRFPSAVGPFPPAPRGGNRGGPHRPSAPAGGDGHPAPSPAPASDQAGNRASRDRPDAGTSGTGSAPHGPPKTQQAAMEAAVPAEEALVLVEYGFEYRAKDGTLVSIKPNERYVLLKRTNHHWWHVRRSGDPRPFYIPAQYVKELPPMAAPAPLESPRTGTEPTALGPPEPTAYEYRFIRAAGREPGGCSLLHGDTETRKDTETRRDSVPQRDPTTRRDSVPRKGSVFRRDPVPQDLMAQRDSVPPRDTVPRRDVVAQDVVAQRESPPLLSSFRVPPGLSPLPAEPVRPSQSLDDLAPRGATTVGTRGDIPGHPFPLSKSHSETLCASSKDKDTTRRWSGSGHGAQAPKEPPDQSAPIYLNLQELQGAAVGAEEPGSSGWEWETHRDTESGHVFYYHPGTGETTWDCPFGQGEDAGSPPSSPTSSLAPSPELSPWEQHLDQGSGQAFFYNWVTGETSWDPPPTGDGAIPRELHPGGTRDGAMEQRPPTPEADYPELSPEELGGCPEEDSSPLGSYTEGGTFCLPPPQHPEELGPSPGWGGQGHPEGPGDCPELLGTEKWKSLEKAGVLNRTKTADKGKRIRKNWSSSWTVLEGPILTFFKDTKHSPAAALRHPSTLSTPEHTVELCGATLTWATRDKSSKKHVLELRTREGSAFLLQHDSEQIMAAWHQAISSGISRMGTHHPEEEEPESRTECGTQEKLGGEDRRADPRGALGHVRGVVSPAVSGQGTGGDSEASKVRNKLRKFLLRRPTAQSLRERGYIRDPVFGCPLAVLCERERGTVPRFVLQCIQSVERRGLDIDGLYRISGNLATIQKLRYKVEHDERLDLDDGRWEDVHLVTGALKLFFRELPEPLVPFSHFDKFIAAIKLQDPARRGRCLCHLVSSLPPAHHDTMRVLFRHLCRVTQFQEQNRMSLQGISIVFGPTLLRPPGPEPNVAAHAVFQNQVVENLLTHYRDIFPEG